MPVTLYALMLLVFRTASIALIVDVIRKQIILRKRPVDNPRVAWLRQAMYTMALFALAMNIIPVIIDILTIFDYTTRPAVIQPVSVVYMLNSSVGTLILTALIWRMYRDSLK